ncbi:MAG: nitrite reductase small subunit NirD [Actinomycetota bacterium]|nr:nitrite reductase small subunit NirD [Actinomycetota bacterium]
MSAAVNGYPVGMRWESVCRLDQLQPGRGVAALLEGRQIALFRLVGGDCAAHERVDGQPDGAVVVHAIDNIDPISGAAVLSRGIVGDRQGRPVVASPVYKQAFSLETGRCLDEPGQEVEVFSVRVTNGWVQVGLL